MKKLLLVLLVAAVGGGAIGYYLWNKPPESMAKKSVDLGMPAAQLIDAFAKDENAANGQYLGKIIAVTGTVQKSYTEDGTSKVLLDGGAAQVFCELDNNTQHPRTTFAEGSALTIKGECAGMQLDGSVQLSHCAEVQ